MSAASPKILIVDDEPDLLDITAAYLEMEGYTPLTALNGPAALEILNSTIPDLIISDITMPGMSGFDLFGKVRSDTKFQNTPFIFLSGHTDLQHIMTGKELGSDDYLMKPYEPEMLISTIKGKLKRSQQLNDSMSQQIDSLKNQLFRLISHEMRTPLTSILGAADILAGGKETLSPEDFTEFLKMLKVGTLRLNRMVEDFLLVVKIDSGEVSKEIDFREACIVPLEIATRLALIREEIKKTKDITLNINVRDESPYLFIYPPHFDDIVARLFDNACKFSPPGAVITLASHSENDRYIFSVVDNGNGIPMDKQDRLFQKFYQVDRDSQEQQGAGLGLYISKKLAEMNKCILWCESDRGRGAAFHLSIAKKV
jgi:two-component system, sensor histidine kinase and response regulator